MRRTLTAGVTVALAAASIASFGASESALLGITIRSNWKNVLAKYGQPSRIEIGPVSAGGATQAGSITGPAGMGAPMGGMAGPGMPMMGGMSGAPTAPMMGGMASAGGAPTAPMMGGMASAGGMSSRMSSMMGGRSGLPGLGGMGPMSGPPPMGGMTSAGPGGMSSRMGAMMGLPGRSGPTGMSGMAMGGPPPGVGPMMSGRSMGGMIGGAMSEGGMTTLGGGAAGTTDLSPAGEGEVSWVYEKGTDTKVFLFNKDGLVIQIQSFGYKGATRTSSGVALGDVTRKVYAVYGWPDSVISSGDTMTLSYGKKANVAFQLVDRHNGQGMRVVGITVALTEAPKQP